MRKKSGGYHGHVPGKLQPMSTRDTISADERLRGVPDTALRPWKGTCMKEIQRLLTLFADAHGVSGHEGAVASLLAAELEPLVDEVTTDGMGNVVGTRNGTGPSIMIAAHMDEIGFMVKYIDENGFLRFVPLGGWSDQMALGQRVFVHGAKGEVMGVIGAKPPHIMDEEERKKIIKIKDMFIDVGASDAENAAALGIEIGSPVTLDRAMAPLANDLVTGKSFDDRAGVVMMILAMQRLKGKKIKATVHAVGTVQEEVGLKGARTSAFSLDPDAAIISEVGIPGDHPGVTKEQRHVVIGKGPVLTVVDADLGDDGGVGIEAEGTGAGALETHLLLDGAHRVHRGLDLLVLQALHGCDHHDHTGPIVETLTGDEIVGERRHRSVECHGRPRAVPCPDYVAHGIRGDFIHEWFELGGEERSHRTFMAGHSVRVGEEGKQALDLFHAGSFPWTERRVGHTPQSFVCRDCIACAHGLQLPRYVPVVSS